MLKRILYEEGGNKKDGLLTENGMLYNAATGILIDRDTVRILETKEWISLSTANNDEGDEIPDELEPIEIRYFTGTNEYILWSNEKEEYVLDKEGNVLSFSTREDAVEYIRKEASGK